MKRTSTKAKPKGITIYAKPALKGVCMNGKSSSNKRL